MNLRLKITIAAVLCALVVGVFVVALPSLIGMVLTGLILLASYDFLQKRRRMATRTLNLALRSVCNREGAVLKVVTAFARQGPIRGPCYEYARRLMVGQDPVRAAADAGVPLQLTTAVAMRTAVSDQESKDETEDSAAELSWSDPTVSIYMLLFYVTLTALVTCAVLSFVTVFVVPSLEQILEEFGSSMESCEWLLVGTTPTWVLLGVLVVMMLILFPVLIRSDRFASPILNWLPISPQAAESRADMLDGLADAVETGMPFAEAIKLAGEISIHPREYASLSRAAGSLQQGTSAADALYQSGWIEGDELSWLRDAPDMRFAQLLRHFGRQGMRDARANLQWLLGIMFPVFIVLLGAAVLSYAFGFVAAISKIIGLVA